jgi:hypothetical protein
MRNWNRWGARRAASGVAKAALLGALIGMLLASSVAMVSAARTLDIAPKMGDILVFKHGARLPSDWDFAVTTSQAIGCVLTPAVMAADGGSLVVEQRFNDSHSYHVHWAGGRTSDGATDCGRSADLVVTRAELQLLSNAVGGPGVEHDVFGWL